MEHRTFEIERVHRVYHVSGRGLRLAPGGRQSARGARPAIESAPSPLGCSSCEYRPSLPTRAPPRPPRPWPSASPLARRTHCPRHIYVFDCETASATAGKCASYLKHRMVAMVAARLCGSVLMMLRAIHLRVPRGAVIYRYCISATCAAMRCGCVLMLMCAAPSELWPLAKAELLDTSMFIYKRYRITPRRGRYMYVSFSAVRCALLVLDTPVTSAVISLVCRQSRQKGLNGKKGARKSYPLRPTLHIRPPSRSATCQRSGLAPGGPRSARVSRPAIQSDPSPLGRSSS